jgi:hypothetical protein
MLQERLTDQIKNCIQDALRPCLVAVVIEAQHMCMQMWYSKQNSVTTTSFTGALRKIKQGKEFISLVSELNPLILLNDSLLFCNYKSIFFFHIAHTIKFMDCFKLYLLFYVKYGLTET